MPGVSTENCESIARCLEFLRAESSVVAKEDADARWKLSSKADEDGLECAVLQRDDAEFVTVRGRMKFAGLKPARVQQLITDCVNRPAWDDMLEQGSFVRDHGTVESTSLPECKSDLIRLVYKGVMGVSARDLCLLRAWGQDKDGTCWLVAESCVDEAVPEDAQLVRAELRECGYLMTPLEDGCEVVYISQTKLGGWIPAFVQNILAMQQPQSLANMYEVLASPAIGG